MKATITSSTDRSLQTSLSLYPYYQIQMVITVALPENVSAISPSKIICKSSSAASAGPVSRCRRLPHNFYICRCPMI